MNCEEYRVYFIDYIDKKLSIEKHNEISNHLMKCKECKKEINQLKETINFIQKESADYLVPENFLHDIKDTISNNQFVKSRNRRREATALK